MMIRIQGKTGSGENILRRRRRPKAKERRPKPQKPPLNQPNPFFVFACNPNDAHPPAVRRQKTSLFDSSRLDRKSQGKKKAAHDPLSLTPPRRQCKGGERTLLTCPRCPGWAPRPPAPRPGPAAWCRRGTSVLLSCVWLFVWVCGQGNACIDGWIDR